MQSCKKYINLCLRFFIVFLILIPTSHAQSFYQCRSLFEREKDLSFDPLFSSSFKTNIDSLVKESEVQQAFTEIQNYMYRDGKLTPEYLKFKSELVKQSIIPFKKKQQKFSLYREDGEVDKISYNSILKKIEEQVQALHPQKVKTVADFLTLSTARKNNNKIDYKQSEALEDLYRSVKTNMDAMRGKPKLSVRPVQIFKDAIEFMKGENTSDYTKRVLIGGAIVDAIAVMAFRFMEMTPSQAFWQSEMLFYFAQSYISFQVMQMLVNPVYTNNRLTHKQSFVKTYATSVALYTMFVPAFRFLHDQFLGGYPFSISPTTVGTYTVSMLFYAMIWKIPNEILFRKVISPIFFDHFISRTDLNEITDVKRFSEQQLIDRFNTEKNELQDRLNAITSIKAYYYERFSGNMNGNYSVSYKQLYEKLNQNEFLSEKELRQVLWEHFGIKERNPRIKHPDVVERDIFTLQKRIKGLEERIKWTEFFRKGLKPGQSVPKSKMAFYYSYEQMGRIFTASVMISAFIIGQKMFVGESMFEMNGIFSEILNHMSGMSEKALDSNYGN